MNKYRLNLFVLSAYLVLTLVMLWPVAQNFTTAIAGVGHDGWENYWNLWWVKQALLVEGTNPYFTDYLYAPNGASLLFHTLNIFNGLWTLPLQLNGGGIVAYNGVVWFSFVMSGYGGYLLALHTLTRLGFTQDAAARSKVRLAAFVAGAIFTMSPFHMAHLLGHMQVFSMQWIPFYILFLLRAIEPQAPRRTAGLASLFLVLVMLVSYYHAVYMVLLTGLVVAWAMGLTLIQRQPIGWIMRPLIIASAIGVGFAVLISPLLLAIFQERGQNPPFDPSRIEATILSADVLYFVTPSELHPLWGHWISPFIHGIATDIANGHWVASSAERVIFLGFTPLLLMAIAVVRYRRQALVWLWSIIALGFVILALGPYLHIYGIQISINNEPVLMPVAWLYDTVPVLAQMRSVSRYVLVTTLAVGVLAAVGLVRWPYYVSLLALGLICFEFWVVPYPTTKVHVPAFYTDIAAQPDDYGIVVLPMHRDYSSAMLHQTVHRKPLLSAVTSRLQPTDLTWRTPIFQQWRFLRPDIIDLDFAAVGPTIFADFNLRYIAVDNWNLHVEAKGEQIEYWLHTALPDDATPIYDDGRLQVYETPPLTGPKQPYLSLGDGWPFFTAAGEFGRHFEEKAEFWLHHPQNRSLAVEIAVNPGNTDVLSSEFWLAFDDEPLVQWAVSPTAVIKTTPLAAGLTVEQVPITLNENGLTVTIPLPPVDAERARLTLHGDSLTIRRIGLVPN